MPQRCPACNWDSCSKSYIINSSRLVQLDIVCTSILVGFYMAVNYPSVPQTRKYYVCMLQIWYSWCSLSCHYFHLLWMSLIIVWDKLLCTDFVVERWHTQTSLPISDMAVIIVVSMRATTIMVCNFAFMPALITHLPERWIFFYWRCCL